MTEIYRRLIAENPNNPYRLGRHINHDPRSKAFAVRSSGVAINPVFWMPNNKQPFDQGSLGSCTGNMAAKAVSTAPFELVLTEADAVAIYSAATKIDPFKDQYPPTDTGSDGASVMKVLQSLGYIKSYSWGFNVDQILAGLMSGPGGFGIEWREGMFTPDVRGRVRPIGAVAGGHEILFIGWDADSQEFILQNSWGASWGVTINGCPGCFRIRLDDLAALMATGGDCVFPLAA
jgi:hypothetical protein